MMQFSAVYRQVLCCHFTRLRPLCCPRFPPGGEALDFILMEALGPPAGQGGKGGAQAAGAGFINQLGVTLSGLQRFMRSLSQ